MKLESLSEALGHLLQPPFIYMVAVTIVLLVLLYLYHSYRRANQGIVPFKSQGGSIEIAPGTLRGVIQNAVSSVEGVEKAVCRHFIKRRKLGVKVAIHLRANHRLKDVEYLIKKRVRATLLDQFGMDNVEPIHIRISRIVGDPMATILEEDKKEKSAPNASLPDDGTDEEELDERSYAEETRL